MDPVSSAGGPQGPPPRPYSADAEFLTNYQRGQADGDGSRRRPAGTAYHQRPAGGPSRSEGPLGHLLYSIALARNDKSRIAALLTLEANCASLLPDTQRLHVAFTAFDAIVSNSVPFTLKTGGPRGPHYNRTNPLRPPVRTAQPKETPWLREGGPATLGAPKDTCRSRSMSPNTPEGGAPGSLGPGGPEGEGGPRAAAASPPQQKSVEASLSVGSTENPSASGGPPGGGPYCSSDSVASLSAPEASFSFPGSPCDGSSSSSSSAQGAPQTPPLPPPRSRAVGTRAPPPGVPCSLVVSRPFSVLSRTVAMQVWVSICVSVDCLLVAPRWLERLVGLLHAIARNVGAPQDACVRSAACACLEELELAYPGRGPHGIKEGPPRD